MSDSGRPADDNLQFDQFEPAPPAPGAEGQPQPPVAPAGGTCAACLRPIDATYFEANGQVYCPQCRDALLARQTGGSRLGRAIRAIVFGTVAGLGGTLIWLAVRKLTGYEVGLIAIVVGLMVGGAVRAGSRGRGGVFYQLVAVFLTYSAIAANYMPDVFQAMYDQHKEGRAAAAVASADSSTRPSATSQEASAAPATTPSDTDVEAAGADSTTPVAEAAADEEPVTAGRAIVGLVVLGAITFAIAFVSPVLMGFSNIIGLLIIGFALWEAWKINKRVELNFNGPYAMGGAGATQHAPLPPPLPALSR